MGNQGKKEDKVSEKPEKKFRAGGVSATVWKNTGKNKAGEDVEFKTVSIDRVYKDKEGEFQNTSTMRINDLPKVALVATKAFEYLVIKQDKE